MYEVTCLFCRHTLTSDFYDEIEEHILACRDLAPLADRGTLATVVLEPTRTTEQELVMVDLEGLARRIYSQIEELGSKIMDKMEGRE